jgi:predicted Rossmann fold nucleotide-binding protein DprA/Smf involved in DNA uptake
LQADRIVALLERGGSYGFLMEKLSSKGIHVVTRIEPDYPGHLRRRLRESSPPLFFYAGDLGLARIPGVAVVGSRDADAEALSFSETLGRRLASEQVAVVSGGARGVDQAGVAGCLAEGGKAVVFLADELERRIADRETREPITSGSLLVLHSESHALRFTVPMAMQRNVYIYAHARSTVVVSSSEARGGTYAGAEMALKKGLGPVWVRDGESAPPGNAVLIRMGCAPFQPGLLRQTSALFPQLVGNREEPTPSFAAPTPALTSEPVKAPEPVTAGYQMSLTDIAQLPFRDADIRKPNP